MADLHPLFVHGGAVFRAAGGALLLAGMLGPYLVRARRLARDAAAARAAMPAPTPLGDVSERGGEACVEGVLAGGRGARVVGWSAAPAGEPEGGLTLRVGAEEIAIAGPVAVVAGARETTARDPARLARRLGIALPPGGAGSARRALLLRAGDRVRVLAADLVPPAERRRILGDLGFVWGDAQGMEFAKLLVNRTGQALLEELGPGQGPSPDLYRYGLYPDAYLARNLPASDWAFTGVFEMGNDIAHMQRHERTHLQEHPYAIFAALVAAGRGDARDAEEVRVHLVGHVALFLAATGDAAGARAALARLADLPDRPSQEPRWVRPGIGALTAGVEALARERPFAMKGVVHGVLDAALAGAYGEQVDGQATGEAVARLRAVVLDREIAVPLQMLEAFARR
jgi:hypothetical protein